MLTVNTVSADLKKFIQSWLINTLAVLVAAYVLHGKINYGKPLDLFVASLLLGILNAVLRPLLLLLTLPVVFLTLGLFTLVINAGLLYLVGYLLRPQFSVDSFSTAFWGALIISLVSLVLNSLTGTGKARVRIERRRPPPPPPAGPGGGGPVIDV